MKNSIVAFIVTVTMAYSSVSLAAAKLENRCGWFDNPSASNASFTDKDGEWEVAVQGGHQAKGPWPKFDSEKESEFVQTGNGSYGFGCVCLFGKFIPKTKTVAVIKSSKTKPLSQCRADSKLKEPVNPLADES